jgi:hypothetical protein
MDESEWLSSDDLFQMLRCLRDNGWASERKLRLFACACVRRVWDRLPYQLLRDAIEVCEDYADGDASFDQLRDAWYDTDEIIRSLQGREETQNREMQHTRYAWTVSWAVGFSLHGSEGSLQRAMTTADLVRDAIYPWQYSDEVRVRHANETESEYRNKLGLIEQSDRIRGELRQEQCNLLREIFGNPFRPVELDPLWLTEGVQYFSEEIYYRRSFEPDRMDMLVRALQGYAYCTNEAVLAHCREPGPHVRGCWVIDLLRERR